MIEDISDLHRGSYGRHHGLHRESAVPFRHLADQVRQIAVIGGTGAAVLAQHLARALDAGLLGLGPQADAAAFEAQARVAEICPLRWRAVRGEPTIDDLQTVDFVVTDDAAGAQRLAALRPTLFSCPTPRTASIGTDVLIVWDGSDDAARAVRAVRPLLRDARHVRILATGHADPAIAEDILEQHGILSDTEDETGDLAASVRELVAAHGIDLLVSARPCAGRQPAWSTPLPYPACAWFTA